MVERGKYLANNVSSCIHCHSTHNEGVFGRPPIDGTEGMGGTLFGREEGLPGDIYAPNITPYALGSWTDGEIVRAISCGVNKDNKPLFPLMSYLAVGQMSKEDVYSIVSYLRTLKPIETKKNPERSLDFPLNMLVNTMPKNADYQPIPDKKNKVLYGKYMTNAAGCFICHTQMDKGEPIKGKEFAGGEKFKLKGKGTVISPNITPDMETGIGAWKKDDFIRRFKSYQVREVKEGEFQSLMPWASYSRMTEEDLGAIYEYLRTVPVVKNTVATTFISEKQ
jgi:hypothetical protein